MTPIGPLYFDHYQTDDPVKNNEAQAQGGPNQISGISDTLKITDKQYVNKIEQKFCK
jgi:hypothetical protein